MTTFKSNNAGRCKLRSSAPGTKGGRLGTQLLPQDLEDLLVADGSQRAFRRFLRIALRLCNAGSAGLSMLRLNAVGQPIVRWEVISGALVAHEGVEFPCESSPCSECLNTVTTRIVSDPHRAFLPLAEVSPAVSQDLIVPLYDQLKNPVGALWVAHHDPASRFDAAEVRIAEQLGILLERAVCTFERDLVHHELASTLESHQLARRVAAYDLSVERSRREHAEASESSMRKTLMFKEAEILDAHHRVKNTIQIAANYLQLQAGRTTSSMASAALQEGYARLHLLADVHELLYKGGDAARRVQMRDLLDTVAETLRQSFCQLAGRVVLSTAIEPILLDARSAIPLASLANEATTNAYKHAFADGRAGEVSLALRCTTAGVLVLKISDNGIGLQSSADGSTLGLELIKGFAAQLGGRLVFDKPASGSGTMLTLSIPAAELQTPRQGVMM